MKHILVLFSKQAVHLSPCNAQNDVTLGHLPCTTLHTGKAHVKGICWRTHTLLELLMAHSTAAIPREFTSSTFSWEQTWSSHRPRCSDPGCSTPPRCHKTTLGLVHLDYVNLFLSQNTSGSSQQCKAKGTDSDLALVVLFANQMLLLK